jgi:hypothetical protein
MTIALSGCPVPWVAGARPYVAEAGKPPSPAVGQPTKPELSRNRASAGFGVHDRCPDGLFFVPA